MYAWPPQLSVPAPQCVQRDSIVIWAEPERLDFNFFFFYLCKVMIESQQKKKYSQSKLLKAS